MRKDVNKIFGYDDTSFVILVHPKRAQLKEVSLQKLEIIALNIFTI